MFGANSIGRGPGRRARDAIIPTVNYCSRCGREVERKIPPGDNRERFVCGHCGAIHYQNPRIVTGCLPLWEGRVLLCRRAIEPRRGLWTLPAGFLEVGETVEAGALRETWEEARARVDLLGLYTLFSVPHISQVHMFFRGSLVNGEFAVGDESLDVRLFDEDAVPWDELAFPVVGKTLQHYFTDRGGAGRFPVHTEDLVVERR